MTITIDLPPELEAGLSKQAAAQGLSLQQYVRRLIEQHAPRAEALSPEQRAVLWRDGVADLPHTPPLSNDAIARETIYAARG